MWTIEKLEQAHEEFLNFRSNNKHKYCQNCNTAFPTDKNFCSKCGAKLGFNESSTHTPMLQELGIDPNNDTYIFVGGLIDELDYWTDNDMVRDRIQFCVDDAILGCSYDIDPDIFVKKLEAIYQKEKNFGIIAQKLIEDSEQALKVAITDNNVLREEINSLYNKLVESYIDELERLLEKRG